VRSLATEEEVAPQLMQQVKRHAPEAPPPALATDGKGAYPQVRCVLLCECGTHAVVALTMDRYDVSEVHGAHRLLSQIGPNMRDLATSSFAGQSS
jgi:hypothetical protein